MAQDIFQTCISECLACAAECDYCAASCLAEQDVRTMAHCIMLDMDCAQLCRLAASYMARDSEFAPAVCAMCAEVCEACADECAHHSMAHCRMCAEACRRCAAECRRMVSAVPMGVGQGMGMTAH